MLEALRLFSEVFQEMLVVESNSSNAIGWMLKSKGRPWKF